MQAERWEWKWCKAMAIHIIVKLKLEPYGYFATLLATYCRDVDELSASLIMKFWAVSGMRIRSGQRSSTNIPLVKSSLRWKHVWLFEALEAAECWFRQSNSSSGSGASIGFTGGDLQVAECLYQSLQFLEDDCRSLIIFLLTRVFILAYIYAHLWEQQIYCSPLLGLLPNGVFHAIWIHNFLEFCSKQTLDTHFSGFVLNNVFCGSL